MQRNNAKKVKERQVQAEGKKAVEKKTWTDRNPVYKGTSVMENDFHGIILSTCGLLRYYKQRFFQNFAKLQKSHKMFCVWKSKDPTFFQCEMPILLRDNFQLHGKKKKQNISFYLFLKNQMLVSLLIQPEHLSYSQRIPW